MVTRSQYVVQIGATKERHYLRVSEYGGAPPLCSNPLLASPVDETTPGWPLKTFKSGFSFWTYSNSLVAAALPTA